MNAKDAERDVDRRLPEEIAFSLQNEAKSATLLVGPGQYSPYANHQRIMVLRIDQPGAEPKAIWDRFLHKDAITPLILALGAYAQKVWPGEFDTMYGTPWAYAWTTSPEIFQLYDRQGRVIDVQDDKLVFRGADSPVILALSDIANIEGWLSSDWVEREVRIVLRNGQHHVIARAEEEMAHLDPTYDGLNLMCDASWVSQLGNALAKGAAVSYRSDDSTLS